MGKKGVFFLSMMFAIIASMSFLVSPSVSAAGKPIILGAPLPLAGHYGWSAERAAILAVEQINAAGGVNVAGEKRPFKLEVIDDRDLEPGVPVSECLMAFEKLILEKKAEFIVCGPVRSEAGMAVQNLAAEHKIININAVSLTPAFPKRVAKEHPRLRYIFHTCLDFGWVAKNVMVPFMDHLQQKYGLTRMFSMVQDVAYARKTSPLFEKLMSQRGWKVTGHEVYPTGASDFSMGLFSMKEKKAQVMMVWMDMVESAILLQQWSDLKIPAIPFGFIAAADQPGFWKTTHGKVEHVLVNPIDCGDAPSNATPKTMPFTLAYKERWGLEPEGHGCATSYDTIYILKAAIERAGTTETEAVIKALEQTDMVGVGGRIRFEPKSHQIIGSNDPKEGYVGTIFQWIDGKRVVVWPEKIAVGEVQLPSFMEGNMK